MKTKKTSRSRLFPSKAAKPWRLIGATLIGLGLVAAVALLARSYAAGNATLSLNSATVAVNSNVTLDLRLNTGSDPANVVHAELAYPTDKLEFVSMDVTGSAFPKCVESASNSVPNWCMGGNGKVTVVRYSDPTTSQKSVSGDVLVAKVTFKALASSGTANVTFASTSLVAKASDNTNALNSTTPGVVTFTGAPTLKPGDVNGDSIINGQDIAIVVNNLGRVAPVRTTGDVNTDGLVNGQDIAIVVNNLGR